MNMLSCSMSGSYARRAYDEFAEAHKGQRLNLSLGEIEFNPQNFLEEEVFTLGGMEFHMPILHVEHVELTDGDVYVLISIPGQRIVTVHVCNGVATANLNWVF